MATLAAIGSFLASGAGVATIAAVGTGISAAGTVSSQKQQRKAVRAQRRAEDIQRRRREIANARARRKAVAQAAVQRAQLEAEAAARGASTSSSVQGALSSLGSQLAENLGFSSSQGLAATEIGTNLSVAERAKGKAATNAAVAGLPSQFGVQPSLSSFAGLFAKDTSAQ